MIVDLTLLNRALIAGIILLSSFTAKAEIMEFGGTSFYVYEHDPAKEKLELWLGPGKEKPNTFPGVEARARDAGRKVKFATNAGIFEGNFLPTGLHISEGKTVVKLNTEDFVKTSEGQLTPNFYLKPNGVFYLTDQGGAAVVETSVMQKAAMATPRLATQSGPLLVSQGKIHPVLGKDSTSKRYRNGVGVTKDGRIFFACSVLERDKGLSNLYNFASLFRDKLGCPNALYLDGDLSYVYIAGETPPIIETNWFAGIFVVTEPDK